VRPFWILLRHRVTSWLRHPGWGTGTVAGQIVLLVLLLFVLWPVGVGSYLFGTFIREVSPSADVLWVLNSSVLYLLPALTLVRFFLQSPASDELAPYLGLPMRRRGLLRGQAALTLLSVHTLFAVLVVGPVWAAEVVPALSGVDAGAWLVSALLLAGVLPALEMQLLNVLLGRHPQWFLGVLLAGTGIAGVDAVLGGAGLPGASRFVFGTPLAGLGAALLVTGGTYAVLLRVLEARTDVEARGERDRRASAREGAASGWGAGVYRWVESTLPAGRMVALELRQVVRTRRLRGLALMGVGIVLLFFVLSVAELVFQEAAAASPNSVMNIAFWGIGGAVIGVSVQVFAFSADHVEGLLARPHRLGDIVASKMALLWMGLGPGTLLLLGLLPWLPLRVGAFPGGCALYWWGVIVPGMVYTGPWFRTPVDLSASVFSFNGTLNNAAGLALLPVILVVIGAPLLAAFAGAWWPLAALVGGAGLVGLGAVAWTRRPFVRQLDRHRHDMMAGFRENDPI
jgi:hypothetical protein